MLLRQGDAEPCAAGDDPLAERFGVGSRRVLDAGFIRRRSRVARRAADAVGVRAHLKISPSPPVVSFFRISKASGISAWTL